MADKFVVAHLTVGELEEYFLGVLLPEELKNVESHLVGCEACAALAVKIHRSWDVLRDEMDPAGWKDAYLKDCLNRGLLASVGTFTGQLRDQLAEWIKMSSGRAEGFVRVLKGGLHDAADSAADLLFPAAAFPALPPIPYKGAMVTRGEAGIPGDRSFVVLGTLQGPQATVILEGTALVVRFQRLGELETPPLVFLIPPSDPQKTHNLKLTWNKIQKEWIARVEVGQEDLLVAIGPQLEK